MIQQQRLTFVTGGLYVFASWQLLLPMALLKQILVRRNRGVLKSRDNRHSAS
jgi:hypothetical protein